MKRIISAVLAVLICVLTLCGCEKVQSESVDEVVESSESEDSGANSEENNENHTEETADQRIEFPYSYTDSDGKEHTEICSLLVPKQWTFEEKPFGGTVSENGNKILDITVFSESEHESFATNIKDLDTKIIGLYEYYVDSYEMNILEWDDNGDNKHFSLYTLNEYSMLTNGNLYFFRFFCRTEPQTITKDECDGIISTFVITE